MINETKIGFIGLEIMGKNLKLRRKSYVRYAKFIRG